MEGCAAFQIQPLVFYGSTKLSSAPCDHPLLAMNCKSKHRSITAVAAASSSSSYIPAGSAADYSEKLLGERLKKKTQSIAGIDQDELLDPRLIADPDSCFCEFKGVHIHYKVCEETLNLSQEQTHSQTLHEVRKVGLPMILLHGFGASVFSWNRVMKPLAHTTGSKVLAFDRPAFGLTSRVNYLEYIDASDDTQPVNPYSMAFSVLATLHFIHFLKSEKAIVVGHSAGALTAVNAYFEAPEHVAGLILVAPAIPAPIFSHKVTEDNRLEKEKQIPENNFSAELQPNLFIRLGQILSKLYQYFVARIMLIFKGMMDMANYLYKKAISSLLRSSLAVMLVRMLINKFGIAAIKKSWYDASQVTDHVLQGYTKPLKSKGWDRALIEHTVALLTDSATVTKPSRVNRYHQISCPVLIITGDTDRLVPAWNAERLSRAIPGSQLEVIKNCGHLPHEERPNEFLSVVQTFLQELLLAQRRYHCSHQPERHVPDHFSTFLIADSCNMTIIGRVFGGMTSKAT
ncbi:hypothetical protein Nepgr_032346 [Nepenthes gracilis]|uniref:AB hydrolase-1 domain-containing protein n=1 Tax=Nepenthes gracilis TaxID=150966 RepID=A0AAD3TK89_NEPGR|nr:hypothetical protein Nepgr_032346 [Nepenthes gracilis]